MTAVCTGQRVVSQGGRQLGRVSRVGRGRFLVVNGPREIWLRDDAVLQSQGLEVRLVCEGDGLFGHVATPPAASAEIE